MILKKELVRMLEELEKFIEEKMADIEVNVFNQKIKLSYQNNEKERLKSS